METIWMMQWLGSTLESRSSLDHPSRFALFLLAG
jgi:hypothetical protein